jgi:hypothetical protein
MLYPFAPDPDALSDREREESRWNPDRETVILAAAGAALTLGEQHSATRALSRAAETMDRVDLWRARLALRTLSKEQREAIAAAVEE